MLDTRNRLVRFEVAPTNAAVVAVNDRKNDATRVTMPPNPAMPEETLFPVRFVVVPDIEAIAADSDLMKALMLSATPSNPADTPVMTLLERFVADAAKPDMDAAFDVAVTLTTDPFQVDIAAVNTLKNALMVETAALMVADVATTALVVTLTAVPVIIESSETNGCFVAFATVAVFVALDPLNTLAGTFATTPAQSDITAVSAFATKRTPDTAASKDDPVATSILLARRLTAAAIADCDALSIRCDSFVIVPAKPEVEPDVNFDGVFDTPADMLDWDAVSVDVYVKAEESGASAMSTVVQLLLVIVAVLLPVEPAED
jgi:hypothetical protein